MMREERPARFILSCFRLCAARSVVRVGIFTAELELAVTDLLMVIESIVAGYCGSYGDGKKVIRPAFESEHLEADEKGSKRAVGDTAEQAAHTDRGGKS